MESVLWNYISKSNDMMKIKIKENTIQSEALANTLSEEFSNLYQVFQKNKTLIVISKTKIIGAKVIVQKNSIVVVGGFPNAITQLIFTFLFFLLGIILPLLCYFIFLNKKMKHVEKEVATFIKENYRAEIID